MLINWSVEMVVPDSNSRGRSSLAIPVALGVVVAAVLLALWGWLTPYLSDAELAQLTGTLAVKPDGSIEAEIYNGTSHRVGHITVNLTMLDSAGKKRFERRYRLYSLSGGQPLSSSTYTTSGGYAPVAGDKWSWHIVTAEK